MILELSGETEVEGHVSGQDGTNDQLPDLLHCTQALLSIDFWYCEDSCSHPYSTHPEVETVSSAMSQPGSLEAET